MKKKKRKKDVSSPLTVKDQSFTSFEHGPPFSPPLGVNDLVYDRRRN